MTNVQNKLLQMFAYDLPEEEWQALEKTLVQFFAQRIRQKTAKIWNEKGYTQQTMENWLNGNEK